MLYIMDTANLDKIRRCVEFYPIDGVTTNPSIISKEHSDFPKLIKEILFSRSMICFKRFSSAKKYDSLSLSESEVLKLVMSRAG